MDISINIKDAPDDIKSVTILLDQDFVSTKTPKKKDTDLSPESASVSPSSTGKKEKIIPGRDPGMEQKY